VELKAASAAPGAPPGCAETAMIEGLVRALGGEYAFHAVDAPERVEVVEPPATSLLDKAIVYVRFPHWLVGGRATVEGALRAARAGHAVAGLMLDLRGADGAPADELARFVDLFVDDGPALQWLGRPMNEMEEIGATRRPPAETLPLIVLVDEKTQSGAEAFAGMLRARGRALLIGRRTSGQASMRTVLDLPSGSRLALPTGDLVEPGVGVISGRGVSPDVELASPPVPAAPGGGADADQAIVIGVRVLRATRSAQHADLLEAARRLADVTVGPAPAN
jgi:C-terminal processing protease CtpA/Prc